MSVKKAWIAGAISVAVTLLRCPSSGVRPPNVASGRTAEHPCPSPPCPPGLGSPCQPFTLRPGLSKDRVAHPAVDLLLTMLRLRGDVDVPALRRRWTALNPAGVAALVIARIAQETSRALAVIERAVTKIVKPSRLGAT